MEREYNDEPSTKEYYSARKTKRVDIENQQIWQIRRTRKEKERKNKNWYQSAWHRKSETRR
jgi:hypothetical protein